MARYRQDRINEEMVREMAEILRGVKDPRVSQSFVTVTAAKVTPDLKYAKIYYSSLQGDKKEVERGLKAASGYIRKELAARMNLRITPELSFLRDESVAYGAHIETLLAGLTYTEEEEKPDVSEGQDGGKPGNGEEGK